MNALIFKMENLSSHLINLAVSLEPQNGNANSQSVFTCSKLTIETLKQDAKYVQS